MFAVFFARGATLIANKIWISVWFWVIPGMLCAAGNGNSVDAQIIRVAMSKDNGAELQLEARQAALAQVLDELTGKTGVRINYSVLPDGLVTATCVGSTLKRVLECLLAGKADLIFRYSGQPTKSEPQGQPAEAWVLGAKFGSGQVNAIVCSSPESQQQLFSMSTKPAIEPEAAQTDELMKMAKSESHAERAEAVGRLLSVGPKGDASIKETLETALADPDATVRMRALASLAHREGAGASAALQEALHDSNVGVRLTAVDNAGNDVALFQQALTDSDAMVRQLAATRLKSSSKPNDFK